MALFVHLGIGCAAKTVRGKVNLLVCIVAAFLPDLLYFVFVVAKLARPVNWTHSLVMCLVQAVLVFLVAMFAKRALREAVLYVALVLSHWVVDFITWPLSVFLKDASYIPIFMEHDSTLGLGLYTKAAIAYPIEIAAILASLGLLVWYIRRKQKNR